MLHDKKGAALLQVLLVTVVLAGMATMLLRANLSRTTTSRQTRQAVSNQLLINTCQAEINALWSLKDADAFAIDLANCWMSCNNPMGIKKKCEKDDGTLELAKRSYKCKPVDVDGVKYQVEATFTDTHPDPATGQCAIHYDIHTVTGEDDYPSELPYNNNTGGDGNGDHFNPHDDYLQDVREVRLEAAAASMQPLEEPALDKEF